MDRAFAHMGVSDWPKTKHAFTRHAGLANGYDINEYYQADYRDGAVCDSWYPAGNGDVVPKAKRTMVATPATATANINGNRVQYR